VIICREGEISDYLQGGRDQRLSAGRERSVVKSWAHPYENLGSDPGHDDLLL